MVVVRTVTCSVSLETSDSLAEIESRLEQGAQVVNRLQAAIGSASIVEQVQTVRLSLNPLEEWVDFSQGEDAAMDRIKQFGSLCRKHNLAFVSLGPLYSVERFHLIPQILALEPFFNLSASIDQDAAPYNQFNKMLVLAKVIKRVGALPGGNFRFCFSSSVKPSTPFFPASFFTKDRTQIHFSIGLETSSLLLKAFHDALSSSNAQSLLHKCEENLVDLHRDVLGKLQKVCLASANDVGVCFDGIDASMNPSLQDDGIGNGFQRILSQLCTSNCMFGTTGTLTLSYLVTRSIERARVEGGIKLCGYSGLMLPQMEDHGIASAANSNEVNLTIQHLLLYSAVCGVGIDTVPVPASVPEEKLAMLLLDVCSLSKRWEKALSCRVILMEGKEAGDMAHVPDNPYLCDSTVLDIP